MSNAYSTTDKSSLSNPQNAVVNHIDLDWTLDFDSKTIGGSATLSVCILLNDTREVCLDSNGLSISSIEIAGESVVYEVKPTNTALGSQISIQLPSMLSAKDSKFDIAFKYSTSTNASAVQWLQPPATAGKRYPYVFTQGQMIHTRSLLPCMDTPGMKVTYTAKIVAPEWCTVLMSALQQPPIEGDVKGVFRYSQPVPVCPYLIALAAGELESRVISPRVKIWAEPVVVEAAADDFSQTEDFILVAESIVGPYLWTRYDVLCLPPSFPFGGMENPCLTFATPTLLTGDKSLADVIAHEIAHSWTGNLVTNSTWEHFWLNEGWTMWLQRKIEKQVDPHGEEALLLSAQVGWDLLKNEVASTGVTKWTRLVWPLSGEDPDDVYSSTPYEKGFNLLYRLEKLLGTPFFEAFAKAYIDKYKYGYITSGEFRDFMVSYCASDESKATLLATVDWDKELFATGLPETPDFSNSLSAAVVELSQKWLTAAASGSSFSGASSDDIKGWNTKQLCMFLDALIGAEETVPVSVLEAMDTLYSFTTSTNAEIKYRWCALCIDSEAVWILPVAVDMVTSQGRMKFTRPLYRAMRASTMGAQLSIDTFKTNYEMYHPIAKKMIQLDFDKANTDNKSA
mmetsp:Transcript_32923/g.33535  ORF Transcript_32923/g.33535 Transcript_32923/m.33535 type:complete len:624 (+) Transcript_32923:135-2006(+)|eukprot:CAMPEP_0182427400 /NCGR_PEP_ID=MMETSP1167-20130531/17141_1 /TAXON_ID=2988 /ORGANISM="Mallomonas Sp, Strain CCMP3275" /LENGTH=623 /DNA_ID=CAMNT_0024609605 /DNA_START=114 /DNA_END=1985 /DNA_ORIENTATION=-